MVSYMCYKKIQADFVASIFQYEYAVICFHHSTSISTSFFPRELFVCLCLRTQFWLSNIILCFSIQNIRMAAFLHSSDCLLLRPMYDNLRENKSIHYFVHLVRP